MMWSFTQKNRVEPATGRKSGKNLRVASPCSAKWEEMKGTDWMRHCTECNLNVYNFSEMTWKEVERLVASRHGRLCARFYRRADGTMLTQDCPKGLRAVVRRVSRWAGAALSAITVIGSAQAQPRSWSEHIEQAQAESGAAAGNSSQGEGAVSVQVKDPQGAVIGHARVILFGSRGEPRGEVLTDENGRIRLQSLAGGTYTLRAMAAGFESDPQGFVLRDRQTIEVSVTMRSSATMGVVVEVLDAPLIPLEVAAVESFHFEKSVSDTGSSVVAAGRENRSSLPRPPKAYASLALKVKDSRGMMPAGAAVVLRDSRSGREWTGVSDGQGDFVVSSLPRGRYTLAVRATGLNTYFTQVDALQPGEIKLEATLTAAPAGGPGNIEEMRMESAAQENGAEAAFR